MYERGTCEPVPGEDLLKRIDGLKRLMPDEGIDFALIYQNVDIFYFTGTTQKGILVIPLNRDPLLFIEKSVERARRETPLPIIPVRNDREVGEFLQKEGISAGVAGIEMDVLPVSLFERFKRIMGFTRYADIWPSIKELRSVKSAFEIEQIRKSADILSRVFLAARDVVREGATELEVDAALVSVGRKLGHQGFLRMRGFNQEMMTITTQSGYSGAVVTYADSPITGMGLTPAVPIGSSFKKVERGVPVTIDYGGGYNGYTTDETRVFVAGELKDMFRKPYDTARGIIEDVMSYAGPGTDCTEIFLRAERMVKKAGLQEYFMGHGEGQVSFIGHGLGLEINELPFITARHGKILKEGMVFAFEPKFVLPPHGAIGIEVDFVVGPQGLLRTTADSLDIIHV
jgi:Xaa-Pro dipeptidase